MGGTVGVDIIFAHPDYVYPSYTDYRRLAELSGFETCRVSEVDISREAVYVVAPHQGEWDANRSLWRDRGDEHNAVLVWWSLERPGPLTLGGYCNVFRRVLNDLSFDHVWSSDRWIRGEVEKQLGENRVTYVVLGSHEGLVWDDLRREDVEQDYSIVHMSCEVGRRSNIWRGIEEKGYTVAENGWARDRHHKLLNSRFMVNVHVDAWPIMEPLRFALAAAYGLPIITEEVTDGYPYTRQGPEHYVIQYPYEDLVDGIAQKLKEDYRSYRAMGQRMHEAMTTEFGFRRQVEIAAEKTWAYHHQTYDGVIR
jgi:hypothetical protein